MRMLVLAILMGLSVVSIAQEPPTTPPRVTAGTMEAAGTQIILNEVNTADYPEMRIFATVLREGNPVEGLTAEDFRVREEEVDQEPLQVEPRLPPLSVVITLDTSGSMSKRMEETQTAAKAFVTALDPKDSAQLVTFAREVQTLTPMSNDKTAVTEAIDQTVARGDTALYDALYQSVELLAEQPGRKAVVLLSDGVDDDGTGKPLSQRSVSEAIEAAQRINVPVYVIGLGTELDEAILSEIADATGALYINAPELADLQSVYDNIGAQLSGQYAIRYTSNLPADGTPRRVALTVTSMDGLTDSKSYTAPAGEAPAIALQPSPAAEGCADVAELEISKAELAKIKQQYDADLLGATDLRVLSDKIVNRAAEVLRSSMSDNECISQALDAIHVFYREQLISATQRNSLRTILTDRAGTNCVAKANTIETASACLSYISDLYQRKLVTATQRNTLRNQVWDAMLDVLQQQNSSMDRAIELMGVVTELYNKRYISATQRNQGREVLRAESGE